MAKLMPHEKSTLVTCHPDGRGGSNWEGEKVLSSRQLLYGISDQLVALHLGKNITSLELFRRKNSSLSR